MTTLDTVSTSDTQQLQNAFKLKGSLFTLTVLQLFKSELNAIEAQLAQLVEQIPKFFQQTPVVIELTTLSNQETLDFAGLATLLKKYQLIPVGLRGVNAAQQSAAATAGLAILPLSKSETASQPKIKEAEKKPTLLITEAVRSGQQIYAPDSDLIVIASVSPGAELLADGNIHVYGPLRGRALAGVNGNIEARIFCQALDAELISIAGRYQVNEYINAPSNSAIQVYLNNEQLRISIIDI